MDANAMDANAMEPIDEIVYPRRLVMIQTGDNCMFCIDQKGQTYLRYVDFDSKLGYIYCNNCDGHAINAVKVWHKKVAYGAAKYLKNKDIQVKRSSGEVESGWSLDNPVTSRDSDENQLIHCYNEQKALGKWCLINDILELNPGN
jgi:hypothetical protein